jgi:serine/threonine-protein kinase HipA
VSQGGELAVWLGPLRVGLLRQVERRRLAFQYDADHLVRGDVAPLSLSLPLREPPFDDALARPYFANLLPDARLREAVARKLGLSAGNDFALLAALGGECAGAVSLLPPGEAPRLDGEYLPLTGEAFDRLVEELPRRPMLAGERGIRLSLAGAQAKLPVRIDGDRILIARGGLPTTHIVKPEIPGVEGSVRNEAFSMALAARAGLPVPRSWVRPGRVPVYVVERFDREAGGDESGSATSDGSGGGGGSRTDGGSGGGGNGSRGGPGSVARIHAEDFCQALGCMPESKYESEGGPGLAAAFGLLARHSTAPALDRRALLHWTVYNALLQNADAHAKNLSLLHLDGGVRLAPFYDLLCTAAYPDLAVGLAMKVGGEARPAWLGRRHWERFAEQVEIGSRLVLDTVLQLAASLPGAATALAAEQEAALGPAPVVDRVLGLLRARCAQAERALAPAGGRN